MSVISGRHDRVVAGPRLCAITDVGLLRSRNEDAVYVGAEAGLLVVADGLGGLPSGDVASQTAVAEVVDALESVWAKRPPADAQDGERATAAAFERAHKAIIAGGDAQPGHLGMATTLVVSLVTPTRLFTCHVGDVRAYRAHRQGLEQITVDHSLVSELVASGRISPEQARVHPERNIVTQVLGGPEGYTADFVVSELVPGDSVMLCSDGLWGTVVDEEIEQVLLRPASAEQRANELLELALAAGGHDNISLVVYQHA